MHVTWHACPQVDIFAKTLQTNVISAAVICTLISYWYRIISSTAGVSSVSQFMSKDSMSRHEMVFDRKSSTGMPPVGEHFRDRDL